MRTLKVIGLTFCCSLLIMACNSNSSTTTTTDSMTADTNMKDTIPGATTTESNIDDEGATFMKKAAVGGMMEVEAGKVAASNSTNQKVKDFAAMMVTDHSKAGEELKTLAASKKIMLPAGLPAEEQSHLDAMKSMKGKDFDAHYMDMMVTDHAKTVALFKDATKNKDADVKGWAEKTLKVIEGHYDAAKKIKAGL